MVMLSSPVGTTLVEWNHWLVSRTTEKQKEWHPDWIAFKFISLPAAFAVMIRNCSPAVCTFHLEDVDFGKENKSNLIVSNGLYLLIFLFACQESISIGNPVFNIRVCVVFPRFLKRRASVNWETSLLCCCVFHLHADLTRERELYLTMARAVYK